MRFVSWVWSASFAGAPVCAWLLWLIVMSVLLAGQGDQWWADQLYRWQGHTWRLQDNRWLQEILHRGGRRASQGAGVVLILAWLAACVDARWRRWRRPLLYTVLAVALSTGLVALLKTLTGIDCPWDLQRYGGSRPLIGWCEARPAALGRAACFPAGHASAGYAWVALYFCARHCCPRWKYWASGLALLAGATFGLAQQLRGAHFLSHDLATLAICWSVAAALSAWMLRTREQPA